MKLNKVSATMGETELETIIEEAVETKTGLKVSQVTFNVGTRSTGYGMAERDEHYFDGTTIHFESGQIIKADL